MLWSQLLDPEVPSNSFFLSSPLMSQTAPHPRRRKRLHKPNPVYGAEKDEKRKTGKKGLTEGAASGSDSEVEALAEVCTGETRGGERGPGGGGGDRGWGPALEAKLVLRSALQRSQHTPLASLLSSPSRERDPVTLTLK